MTKGEKTRKKLLDTAYEMFLSKGYEETSIEDIISRAHIAKGTYYYYFQSKEQMLEEVIDMMIGSEAEAAGMIAASDAPIQQKIVGMITSFRPQKHEEPIGELLERPENLLLRRRMLEKLMDRVVPLLCDIVSEGIEEGIFSCSHIPQRVRILIIISDALFNYNKHTQDEITVFIDLMEKLLGAESGSMAYITALIREPMQN